MKNVITAILVAICSVIFLSKPALAWWNDDWSFRTEIVLDSARIQPSLSGKLDRVPVLVRLHEGNFRFLDARNDGTDIRFIASDDKTPLNYHIESFDGLAGLAWIWVDVPSIESGKSQTVWLYYGNKDAEGVANAPLTWDGETALVYHFNETAGVPRDHTANGNNAISASARPSFDAIIRQGIEFSDNQQVRIAPSASLATAAGDPFTWSAWIKAESEKPQENATLFTKIAVTGQASPARVVVGLNQNRPYVRVVNTAGAVQEVVADNQIQSGSWVHLALVGSDQLRLHVNGIQVATLPISVPELNGEMILGADIQGDTEAATIKGFRGTIDEFVISNSARSADWLSFAAATQGREASFLSFSAKPEVRGDWFSGGYLMILLNAVTIDGWVVIAILMVMLVISIVVMANRLGYVKKVAQANKKFASKYTEYVTEMARQKRSGVLDIDNLPSLHGSDHYSDSSTYRLYNTGLQELRLRAAMDGVDQFSLDSVSAESLRSALDSELVKEQQELNRQMVMLTISISGGPFLGLLGTVIGVMITFAAIAEAGDVNVNAIAPGVAAALMATVAGLAVAIPALFAYNYLTTRIGEITADMHVFTNDFVSKMKDIFRK